MNQLNEDRILSNGVERISVEEAVLAIIIRAEFRREGISFFTEDTLSQQLAFMRHPAGKVIEPHVHNPVPREVQFTQEVLFIRKGRLRVDFYDRDQCYLESRLLDAGDVILLIQGGHGFEVLEEIEMIEVSRVPMSASATRPVLPRSITVGSSFRNMIDDAGRPPAGV